MVIRGVTLAQARRQSPTCSTAYDITTAASATTHRQHQQQIVEGGPSFVGMVLQDTKLHRHGHVTTFAMAAFADATETRSAMPLLAGATVSSSALARRANNMMLTDNAAQLSRPPVAFPIMRGRCRPAGQLILDEATSPPSTRAQWSSPCSGAWTPSCTGVYTLVITAPVDRAHPTRSSLTTAASSSVARTTSFIIAQHGTYYQLFTPERSSWSSACCPGSNGSSAFAPSEPHDAGGGSTKVRRGGAETIKTRIVNLPEGISFRTGLLR